MRSRKTTKHTNPRKARKNDERSRNGFLWRLLFAPGLSAGRIWRSFAFARRTEAAAVRAVERWRRAHGGELPPSLEALVPEWLEELPCDAWTGEAIAYEPGPVAIPEERFLPVGGAEEQVFPACEVTGWRLGWTEWQGQDEGTVKMRDFLVPEPSATP